MIDIDLSQGLTIRIDEMDGAADTGIEAMDRPQDFQRLLDIDQTMADQGALVGAGGILAIARSGIPLTGDDTLIIRDQSSSR